MRRFKNIIRLLILISSSFYFIACEEEEGACESYYSQYGSYYCTNGWTDASSCEDDSYGIHKYYGGQTCQEIGYTEETSSSSVYESPYGSTYKGSGSTINTSGNTTNNNNGESCSESNYSGPSTTDYPQSANYCMMAWYYECYGYSRQSQEVSTYCAYYNNFENVPNCSYCN